MDASAFRKAMLRHYRLRARTFPWRETADPYAVLVGEVLLQRTRGENAPAVFSEFLRRWPNPTSLSRAREASIATVIRPLGLAKRAVLLKRLGAALTARGEVPADPNELARLPGVGPYAAHAVPVLAHGRNLPVVDWVIARVLRRYFGLPTGRRPGTDRQLWELAEDLVRPGRARELWLGTLDFAASICKPRPLCGTCPLSETCRYFTSVAAAG